MNRLSHSLTRPRSISRFESRFTDLARMLATSSSTIKNSLKTTSPFKMWDVTDLRYEENPHPTVSMRIPGLTHESFDRNYKPKMTSIMQTSSLSRYYASHAPLPADDKDTQNTEERFFLDWPRLTETFFAFMSSSEFVMSRALYDNNIRKWPLDFRFTLGNIGTCSVASVSKFYASGGERQASTNDIPLWTNTNQLVYIDNTTRKPARLPDWHTRKYKGKGCMDKGLVLKPFERPAVTYAHPAVVQWTDTDHYKHTNWATYVRWATDALHAALFLQNPGSSSRYVPYGGERNSGETAHSRARGALHGITNDIVDRGLHKLHIMYLRECLQGEYVEVHVWQNSNEAKELVYFSVVKDGEDICQMKMWYFDAFLEDDEEDYPV